MERRFHIPRQTRIELPRAPRTALESLLATVFTAEDLSLAELSLESPVLLVFLGEAASQECREAVSDLAYRRSQIEPLGIKLAVAYHDRDESMAALLVRYGLGNIQRVADRSRRVAKLFMAPYDRGWHVVGPRVVWRGAKVVLFCHRDALPNEAEKQLPGAFVTHLFRLISR